FTEQYGSSLSNVAYWIVTYYSGMSHSLRPVSIASSRRGTISRLRDRRGLGVGLKSVRRIEDFDGICLEALFPKRWFDLSGVWMRSDADSSKVAYLLHRLFHGETFGNVCLNSYGKDVSEAACYLRPWDYLEARICLGSLSPDESSHHAIVVCYYDPLKALLNGSLYHFSRRVECVESAAAPIAIDS